MKISKTVFTAAMAAALAAVSPAVFPADAPAFGAAVCEAAVSYENEGMTLRVPGNHDGFVCVRVLRDDERGRLFSVAEARSVVAAWLQDDRDDGPGWLFSLGRVSEDRFHDMLCMDMSGVRVFARDEEGNRYVLYHPTDVRMVRMDNEAMTRDMKLWSDLNAWANEDVPADFIESNQGLTGETYDNSDVAIYLARAAYRSGTEYTVSTTQLGPLSSDEVDAEPFVERLIRNASYEMVDTSETPDGEYVVLNFPGEKVRFDFFKMQGHENYVREVREGGHEVLYKATFEDGVTRASKVMQQWYDELAAAR